MEDNYLVLINRFWTCSIERAFNSSDCMLYFYLLNICNKLAGDRIEILSRTNVKPKLCGGLTMPQKLHEAVVARYGDAHNFMLVFNKNIQPVVAENVEKAYLGTAPLLRQIGEAYNRKVLLAWIMAQLENLNDYIGVNQKMNIEQMEELAQIIAVDYHYLKATELHLFLYRLKGGHYGEFFGTIDPVRISAALRDFASERIKEIESYRRIRHNEEQKRKREQWLKNGITRAEYEKLKQKENNK